MVRTASMTSRSSSSSRRRLGRRRGFSIPAAGLRATRPARSARAKSAPSAPMQFLRADRPSVPGRLPLARATAAATIVSQSSTPPPGSSPREAETRGGSGPWVRVGETEFGRHAVVDASTHRYLDFGKRLGTGKPDTVETGLGRQGGVVEPTPLRPGCSTRRPRHG